MGSMKKSEYDDYHWLVSLNWRLNWEISKLPFTIEESVHHSYAVLLLSNWVNHSIRTRMAWHHDQLINMAHGWAMMGNILIKFKDYPSLWARRPETIIWARGCSLLLENRLRIWRWNLCWWVALCGYEYVVSDPQNIISKLFPAERAQTIIN